MLNGNSRKRDSCSIFVDFDDNYGNRRNCDDKRKKNFYLIYVVCDVKWKQEKNELLCYL